ncbi:MAG TPA: adenylate/guanylate cyclase domain-containing protein [Candidatus Limnocylindria bacterium]
MTVETRFARATDGTHVAYQVSGDGPIDLLVMRAWHSNLEHEWEEPVLAGIYRRLGSLGRVIRLDRRGTGLSDRFDPGALPSLEDRIDDIRAVLDAAKSERVVPIGLAHGGALCSFFAATYPERTAGLILWSPPPTMIGALDPRAYDASRDSVTHGWGSHQAATETVRVAGPSRTDDEAFVAWIREDERLTGTADDALAQWDLVLATSVADILPSIHIPALVAWRAGSSSVAVPVTRMLPNATAVELPGDDHMLISGDWRAPLAEMEQFIDRVAGSAPELDRVLATIMFTDIVGSTARASELGDREWTAALERHHAVVRRELAKHRGREIDTAGDGFFAAFDGPARAIRAAVAIRDAIDELGMDLRIGIHAGECERVGPSLRGVAVHVGARVGAAAGQGQILVTSTVRDLVAGSGVEFADAGSHVLKGIPEEWHLYSVVSV